MIFLHPPKNTAFLYTPKKYLETIEPQENIKFENFNLQKNSSSLYMYSNPPPFFSLLCLSINRITENS